MACPFMNHSQSSQRLTRGSCFLALLFVATLWPSCSKAPIPITIYTGEWAPYTSQHPNGVSSGYGGGFGMATDIVTAVILEMGYKPIYEFRDWPVVTDLIKENKIAAAFPYIKTKSRIDSGKFRFSKPLLVSTNVLFYNVKNLEDQPKDFKSLANTAVKLGVVKSYEYDEYDEHDESKLLIRDHFTDVQEFETEVEAFGHLIDGHIDILPSSELVGHTILESQFRAQRHKVAILPGFHRTQGLRLIVPENSATGKQFLEAFNKGLESVKYKDIQKALRSRYKKPSIDANEVILRSTQDYPVILAAAEVGQDVADPDSRNFQIPHGTRAVVVSWADPFESSGPFDSKTLYVAKTEVRILEGPLKDRIVWIPGPFIAFRE